VAGRNFVSHWASKGVLVLIRASVQFNETEACAGDPTKLPLALDGSEKGGLTGSIIAPPNPWTVRKSDAKRPLSGGQKLNDLRAWSISTVRKLVRLRIVISAATAPGNRASEQRHTAQ
jgi:hypothetical protein